jgi:hypothetical protein
VLNNEEEMLVAVKEEGQANVGLLSALLVMLHDLIISLSAYDKYMFESTSIRLEGN